MCTVHTVLTQQSADAPPLSRLTPRRATTLRERARAARAGTCVRTVHALELHHPNELKLVSLILLPTTLYTYAKRLCAGPSHERTG